MDATLQKYKERLDGLLNDRQAGEHEEQDTIEIEIHEMERDLECYLECHSPSDKQIKLIQELLQQIKLVEREYDFYDPEGELDNLYPNRHDEDFDEDEDMSISSFWGD